MCFRKLERLAIVGLQSPGAPKDGPELGCGALCIRNKTLPALRESLCSFISVRRGSWGHGFARYVFSFATQQPFDLGQVALCLSFPPV